MVNINFGSAGTFLNVTVDGLMKVAALITPAAAAELALFAAIPARGSARLWAPLEWTRWSGDHLVGMTYGSPLTVTSA